MTNLQRLNAISKILKKIVYHPISLFLVLKDESEYINYLKRKYGITQFPTVEISNFFTDATINHYTYLDGTSLVTDLALIKSIASAMPNCNYLEIGTWRGESILNIADTGAQCTSISLSPLQIIDMGINEKYAQICGCLIPLNSKINRIYENSLEFDFSTLGSKYDLIFVDADHTYAAVKSDTENVFKLIKDENSVIIWHDYAFNPETPRHSVIAAILDGLPIEEHKYLYHVSNTMCAIYTKQKFETYQLDTPQKPNSIFEVSIKVKPIIH